MQRGVLLALLLVAACAGANGQACLQQGISLLSDCRAEQDYITKSFPLNSATSLSDQQAQNILSAAPTGLPSAKCCTSATKFAGPPAQCQCDKQLLAVLPSVQVSPQGLAGVLKFISVSCKFDVPACP
ncbi:hypothetical protein N2152v2_007708 [Parachlorella kessleri]